MTSNLSPPDHRADASSMTSSMASQVRARSRIPSRTRRGSVSRSGSSVRSLSSRQARTAPGSPVLNCHGAATTTRQRSGCTSWAGCRAWRPRRSLTATATSTPSWTISEGYLGSVPHHTRRGLGSTWFPCLLDADWCLRSDVMTDSCLQATPRSARSASRPSPGSGRTSGVVVLQPRPALPSLPARPHP